MFYLIGLIKRIVIGLNMLYEKSTGTIFSEKEICRKYFRN